MSRAIRTRISAVALVAARIVVMHISILFGGFAVRFLGQPAWMLPLFVVLKTGVDLSAHLREQRAS